MKAWVAWLRDEPWLKLISLLIALCLWAWRTSEGNPFEERRFVGLPVEVSGLQKDLHVVNDPPLVEVTLRGPRRTLDRLQATGAVQPYVDCSEIDRPTWRSTPIRIRRPENQDVQVLKVEPEEWEVEVDTFENDIKPVRVDVGNTSPPEGYIYEPPQLSHPHANVRGPRKKVIRVSYLAAEIDLTGRKQDDTIPALLVPKDSAGQVVKGVETVPRVVNVTVRMSRLEESRQLAVVAPRVNEPPAGFRYSGLEVDPPRVLVRGTSAGLSGIGATLLTEPVDLAGRKASFTIERRLALPPGLTADPETVRVRVRITAESEH